MIMDYIGFEKRVNQLPPNEFEKFYNDATGAILAAKSGGKANKSLTIEGLLEKYNIVLKNTPEVMKAISPALTTNLYKPTVEAIDACPACSLCVLCALCIEINGGVGLAGLAGLVSLVK